MAKRRTEGKTSLSVDPKAVPLAVETIGSSGIFEDDRRSFELLRYLVTEELSGRGKQVNAQHIGMKVLGQKKKFDPVSEREVRLAIQQLRHGLEQYYDQAGQNDPLKISITPTTFRIDISKQKIAEPIQPDVDSKASNWRTLIPWHPIQPQLAIILMLILTFSAVVAAMIFWPGKLTNRADQCAFARPFVAISFNQRPGFNAVNLKSWELALRRYIDYYPRVTQEPGNAASCPGTPSYKLEIGIPADPAAAIVASLTTLDGEFIWSKSYGKEEFAENDGEYLGLAKIAYEIGFGRGVVTLDATNRPWQNKEAFDQYKCVNRAHEYFNQEIASQFDRAVQCLKKYTAHDGAAGDAYGLYAALLLNSLIGEFAQNPQQTKVEIKRLIEVGKSKDSANSELMMVEMRLARYDPNSPTKSFAEITRVTAITEQYFRMEPHLLNQLALGYASQDAFDKALEYTTRAEKIMGNTSSTFIPKTVAYIGLGQWNEAAISKLKLGSTSHSRGQLMLLAVAYETNDPENITFALNQLKKFGITTHPQILAEVDRFPYGNRFKEQLANSINDMFDKQQAR